MKTLMDRAHLEQEISDLEDLLIPDWEARYQIAMEATNQILKDVEEQYYEPHHSNDCFGSRPSSAHHSDNESNPNRRVRYFTTPPIHSSSLPSPTPRSTLENCKSFQVLTLKLDSYMESSFSFLERNMNTNTSKIVVPNELKVGDVIYGLGLRFKIVGLLKEAFSNDVVRVTAESFDDNKVVMHLLLAKDVKLRVFPVN